MDIDITRHIGAVERELVVREHEGRPAQVIVATRVFDTEIEDVWDAITNRERIPRWFLPVSGDLRLGGRYQLEGNAGGEITRCEPPRQLALTWVFGDQVSWVTVQLSEGPGASTTLQLEHIAHTPEEMWEQFGPGAAGVGWDGAITGLAEHLATGRDNDPKAFEAWSASEQGREFYRLSSEAWCRASIAAGTDEAAARAAAERTTAFYTGEEGHSH
jgi:uncharacterized protein YndB with AHSA1/START domain